MTTSGKDTIAGIGVYIPTVDPDTTARPLAPGWRPCVAAEEMATECDAVITCTTLWRRAGARWT